jgi:predicted RNase H-like HicB family nuclease
MEYVIEVDKEEDGRWLAEVMELPGVMVYGQTKEQAIMKAQQLALHVIADQLEDEQSINRFSSIHFAYA